MRDTDDDRQAAIEAQAADWIIRLGGTPLGPEEQRSLEAWRAASPAHEAAFRRASALWSDLDVGGRQKKTRRRRHAAAAATTGALGCALLFAGLSAGWIDAPHWFADYATAPGEIRTVRLADGSIVDLDSRSALAIHYSATERRVALLDGSAYFKVAPMTGDEHRPFVVAAARGTATALGTQFMVTRDAGGVDTTVTEHSVRVATRNADNLPRSVIVPEGQRAHYDPDGTLGMAHAAPVAALTAWRTGQLVFDDAPLSRVVAHLNRYRRGRILLMGRGLGDRRVSGVFSCADIDGAVTTITRELGVKTITLTRLATVIY
ncbi:MAG: FecR family protein [Gluconacetobacter liquefaciens]